MSRVKDGLLKDLAMHQSEYLTTSFKVAAVQFTAKLYDPDSNRAVIEELVIRAAGLGSKLVVLPELAVTGYGSDREELERCAEPLDGPTAAGWRRLARELGVFIVGGICERNGSKLYNSALLVAPDGSIEGYQKLHLFDREREIFSPGGLGLPVVSTSLGKIGICVCYDLRFVEVLRLLALQDADVVAIPTAWVAGFDKNPRDQMGFIGQARTALVQANLNQVALVCASQSGSNGVTQFLGSSLISDPYGICLSGPADQEDTVILTADLDIVKIRASRHRGERINPRLDRRTDVYQVAYGNQKY